MDRNEIEVSERRLVSKVAPHRYDASKQLQYAYTSLGLGIGCLIGIGAAVFLGNPGEFITLVAFGTGFSLLFYGGAGSYVWSRQVNELYQEEDIVRNSRVVESEEMGKPISLMGIDKDKPTRVLVGPVKLAPEQWRLIYKAVREQHMKFSRRIIENSGANVTNLPSKYTQLSKWMLEKGFIEDTAPVNSRYPEYYLRQGGMSMFREAIAGNSIS